MGFWGWLLGGGGKATPAWSPFERSADFDAFVAAVVEVLSERGIEVDPAYVRSGSVMLDIEGRGRVEWHLSTLAETCSTLPTKGWKARIAQAVPRREAAPSSSPTPTTHDAAPKKQGKSSRKGSKRSSTPNPSDLRLQIFSEDYLAAMHIERAGLVIKTLTPFLHAVLVIDLPGGEITANAASLSSLGLSVDELLRLGQRQSALDEANRVVSTRVGSGAEELEIMVSNGFYLAGGMLEILERAPRPRGVLVAFASTHHVVTHPVSRATPPAVPKLLALVEELRRTMDVSFAEQLGGQLTWYDEPGRFSVVELVEVGSSSVRIVGPASLVAALESAEGGP